MPGKELELLAQALAASHRLLSRYGDKWVSKRLRRLEDRAREGDLGAIQSAISESTGGMGSFNDRILSRSNRDAIAKQEEPAANAELRACVERVEKAAREAAAAHGIALWR